MVKPVITEILTDKGGVDLDNFSEQKDWGRGKFSDKFTFKELQFDIYNNWGEIIFTSTEQSFGWDGTYNSAIQPMGVYVYTVKATTLDDVQHELSGDVTLIR